MGLRRCASVCRPCPLAFPPALWQTGNPADDTLEGLAMRVVLQRFFGRAVTAACAAAVLASAGCATLPPAGDGNRAVARRIAGPRCTPAVMTRGGGGRRERIARKTRGGGGLEAVRADADGCWRPRWCKEGGKRLVGVREALAGCVPGFVHRMTETRSTRSAPGEMETAAGSTTGTRRHFLDTAEMARPWHRLAGFRCCRPSRNP
jgi:hypothetical protein